jgi:hypothetical protein
MDDTCHNPPPIDKDSSDSFSELFESDDDPEVSSIEIANPYDERILSKKFLTCHGCTVPNSLFEVKKNITVVQCSRFNRSSSSPKLLNGDVTDTKLLLKKVKDSRRFIDAINDITSQIIPEILDKETVDKIRAGESYTLSKNTEGVARTRTSSDKPIVMREMLIFLRGCFNHDEGIYELDERGEVQDISKQYGLIERKYEDRNPTSNFEDCSYIDYELRSDIDRIKEAEDKHKEKMTKAKQRQEVVRGNIEKHIVKLNDYYRKCLLHQQSQIEEKIQEYVKKLETVTKNIETIQKMRDSILLDGKYYLNGLYYVRKPDGTRHPVVPLSYILNHHSNIDGTLFIIKVCRNICGGERLLDDSSHTPLKQQFSHGTTSDTPSIHVSKLIFSSRRPPISPERPESSERKSQGSSERKRSRSPDKKFNGGKVGVNKPNKGRYKSKKRRIRKRKNVNVIVNVNRHIHRNKYRHMLTQRRRNNVTKKKLNKR